MTTTHTTYVALLQSIGTHTLWVGPCEHDRTAHRHLMTKLVGSGLICEPGIYVVCSPSEEGDLLQGHSYTVAPDLSVRPGVHVESTNVTHWPPRRKSS